MLSIDRINQYFGWSSQAKDASKFYDSTLPLEDSKKIAVFLNEIDYPVEIGNFDKAKWKKYDNFIKDHLLGKGK